MTINSHEQETRGVGPLFLRLYWMFLGNIILAVSFLGIAQGGRSLGFADVGFWFAIVTAVAARYVDVTRFAGLTGTGEPATISDWRKYAIGMLIGGILAWLAAHGFAYSMAD